MFLELQSVIAAIPGWPGVPLRLLTMGNVAADHLHSRGKAAQAFEVRRREFYDRVWREAAAQLGAAVITHRQAILEISKDGITARIHLNETGADDPASLRLAGDKAAVHRILAAAGVPVPTYREFHVSHPQEAEAFLSRAAAPCVVKPARSGSAGRGVTTGVARRRDLVLAVARAAASGPDLLIEREVEGENYRLLFLDGVLLDAFVRRRPTLRGDGTATVSELVQRENDRRAALGSSGAQTMLRLDADALLTLGRQKLSRESVPRDGHVVVVKNVINDNAASENEGASDRLAEPIIRTARAAVGAVGVRLAGVDVITPDPSRPLEETGGVVLEINTTPGLHHHYHRLGDPAPVAVPILASLLGIPQASRAR